MRNVSQKYSQKLIFDTINFQVHCGSSQGAFNEWVKGTKFENWKQREVVSISDLLLDRTTSLMKEFT